MGKARAFDVILMIWENVGKSPEKHVRKFIGNHGHSWDHVEKSMNILWTSDKKGWSPKSGTPGSNWNLWFSLGFRVRFFTKSQATSSQQPSLGAPWSLIPKPNFSYTEMGQVTYENYHMKTGGENIHSSASHYCLSPRVLRVLTQPAMSLDLYFLWKKCAPKISQMFPVVISLTIICKQASFRGLEYPMLPSFRHSTHDMTRSSLRATLMTMFPEIGLSYPHYPLVN